MFNSKEESMEAWASLFGFAGDAYYIFWRKNYGTEDNY